MADYQSSHSGQEIDTAVTNVLNGSCGIQGIQLNGTDITPDASNKVNISTASFFTTGSFTPELICLGSGATDPQGTGLKAGYYYLIDKLCYITFRLDLNITNKGNGSYYVSNLPFTAANNIQEFGITLNEFSCSDSILFNPTIVMHVIPGTSTVQIEDKNGRTDAVSSFITVSQFNFVIGGSGFYITS